jgi:phenylalanyl-tRNA synthetase beta chain
LDWEGKVVGVAGEIHPSLRQSLDLPQSVLLFELSADLQGTGLSTPSFEPLPRYPATTRDLSILVEEGMAAEEIMAAIRKVGGEWLRGVTLFDLHVGAPILSGQKSLAFALTYRAEDRTLSGEEVNAHQEAIIAHLSKAFGARLRS